MANHVWRHLRRGRLEKSRRERLPRACARRKMRRRLRHLIRQRIEVQNLRVGVNRRNAVFVRFRLHVGKNVVALLHLHQRIADARAVLSVAGQRVQHAPVVVHRFVARFAVDVAGKSDVAAVGKHREQFAAHRFVFDRIKSPRPQPCAIERDQVHQRVARMNRRQTLLDAEPRNARVHIFGTLRRRRFNLVRRVRIRGFQLRAMHFRLPLQVGILVHLVGPNRRVQFEAAGDGDDFLPVRDATRPHHARNRDALRLAKMFLR